MDVIIEVTKYQVEGKVFDTFVEALKFQHEEHIRKTERLQRANALACMSRLKTIVLPKLHKELMEARKNLYAYNGQKKSIRRPEDIRVLLALSEKYRDAKRTLDDAVAEYKSYKAQIKSYAETQ